MGNPSLEKTLEAAAMFSASLNFTTPYWLTLTGPSGTGKTHLARAVHRQFMEQNRFEVKLDAGRQRIYGNTSAYLCWRSFCRDIRQGGYELIDDAIEEWFVIIDDMGCERDPNGFIADAIDRIFNGRLGKWTLVTTNLSLKDIATKIDVRVADRMLRNDGVVIEIDSPSYTMKPK